MKATQDIKDVFESYDTNVLNIADFELDDGYSPITHAVLDGNELLLYSANPDLGDDFQDDCYEMLLLEDDDEVWNDIKSAIKSL